MTTYEIYRLYEFGKAWRYGLQFAVNGATLALLLLSGSQAQGPAIACVATLCVSAGMVWFNLLMRRDNAGFCRKMREVCELAEPSGGHKPRAFGRSAQRLLNRLTALLISGWVLVALLAVLRLAGTG